MTDGVLTVLPAPEGYEVNFENPPQVGAIAGYFVTGFGIALAATFLALRLYTRARITRNIGLEDGIRNPPFITYHANFPISGSRPIICMLSPPR